MTKQDHQRILQEQRRVFGRRQGRPLSTSRQSALKNLMPHLSLSKDDLKMNGNCDPKTLFQKEYKNTVFEIGFGNGEHLSEMMRRSPETAFIGAEPFENGMSAFLKDIENDPHDNIRVWMDDALIIGESLMDECLDQIYILNPDPWHKIRHHKRRIVREDTLRTYHRILKPGGDLILTTDVPYLAEWMLTKTLLHGGFDWQANCAKDWQIPPQDWIPTRYETKGAKGATKMSYLFFKKTLAKDA